LIILIILGEEYKLWSSSLCSFLQPPVTSSLIRPNSLLNTLFSNTLSLCSSHNVRDQVSHPYRTTGKITVVYILVFMFLDSRRGPGRYLPLKISQMPVPLFNDKLNFIAFRHFRDAKREQRVSNLVTTITTTCWRQDDSVSDSVKNNIKKTEYVIGEDVVLWFGEVKKNGLGGRIRTMRRQDGVSESRVESRTPGERRRCQKYWEVGVEENRYLNMTAAFVCSKQCGATNNRNNVAWNCINGTAVLGTAWLQTQKHFIENGSPLQ
jgi:hypothetical protein